MALLTIAEPGQSAQPHQRRLAVGIDLGTTNSLVATIRNAQLEILPDAKGRNLCPSAVYYGQATQAEAKPLVGYEALAQASRDPKNTIISVKRFIGKKLSEVQAEGAAYNLTATENGLPLFNTAAGAKNAISVSAEILSQLKAQAEQRLGGELYGAVITVPAYFDDTQRQATKDAAELAGLKVLRLLNEPTAAAIAYGINENQEGTVVVYDLGGGTFDVSVLRIEKGVFQVLATGGDTALGGDDYDQALLEHFLALANLDYSSLPDQVRRLLLEVAIESKKALSQSEQVELASLPAVQSLQGYASTTNFTAGQAAAEAPAGDPAMLLATGIALLANATLTRAEFDALTKKLTDKTLLICHRVLKDAKVTKDQVNQVILVGGSTRMPVIAQQVEKFFGRAPLCSQNPDEVVALGAAMQADLLAGNKDADYLLLDVLPLSLGVEVYGGLVEKIIPRNTTIPTARAQEFTTAQDGQTGLKLHVVQGERDMAADCRSLANFSLKGLPPRAAGALKIRVTYQVDADGLLSVSAKELTSGVSTQVQVKLSYGLTEDEVLKMLQDSSEFAQLDVALRKLSETQVESELLCESVAAQLNNYEHILGQLLTRDEHEQILRNLEHVHKLRDKFSLTRLKEQGMPEATADGAVKHVPLNNSHAQQLKEWANELYFWTQQLEVSTREFAAKIMTQSVKEALTGKHVDKVDI